MNRRRVAAIAALLFAAATFALAAWSAFEQFPTNLIAFACVALAVVAAWIGVLHRRWARALGLAVGALAFAVALALLIVGGGALETVLVVAGLLLSLAAGRAAFWQHVPLAPVPAPRRPVLFFNPKSGGGKAQRFSVATEARARGIQPIELHPGSDLERLVREAVTGGADALAMAGGDGSQAIVAAIAAELDLPYACVPAGTRNHFALDLGVDRNDVVGALDAFVDGGEKRVDLAEVNGRVFVNNVSLGLYGEAVQRAGYRDAKVRTLVDTMPDVFDAGTTHRLGWRDPAGQEHRSAPAMIVSNNPYRLAGVGAGTRPRIDSGLLGVVVAAAPERAEQRERRAEAPVREWAAAVYEVNAEGPVPVGIDGEAMMLDPPLRFRARPRALRVRIARAHPGASPSAEVPERPWAWVRALGRIAAGRTASEISAVSRVG
jgi:diacylglycerol kinase family enzyme